MNLQSLREKLDLKKGGRAVVLRDIEAETKRADELTEEIGHSRRAQELIQVVAEMTQKQLEYRVSELVGLAMGFVFDDPYDVALRFVPRRGKTDCTFNFLRNDEIVHPTYQSGFGAVNIAGFGCRIGCMSLSDPKPRPVLILDEPFPNLKGIEANARAIQMVKRVSDNMGIQVLMVSDERAPIEEIEDGADRVFHVDIRHDGISRLTVRKGD